MPHRSLTTEYVWEHRHLGNVPLAMDRPTMNTSDVGRYLHVTRERARQIVNGRDSFPTPVVTDPRRRWDAVEVTEWAERHWWGHAPLEGRRRRGWIRYPGGAVRLGRLLGLIGRQVRAASGPQGHEGRTLEAEAAGATGRLPSVSTARLS